MLNPYHNASQPWPEDILRIRANIYKQRHLHSKAIAKQNNRRHRGKQHQQPQREMTTTSSKSTNTAGTFSCAQSEETFSGSFGAAVKQQQQQQQQQQHHHRLQQQGTKPLTIDAETNTYLNNSYAFNLTQLESCATNVDKLFAEDKHQCDEDQRHHHRHLPPPSSKNTTTTNKKTKMMHTMTSGVSCEHSSASGVDFFNIATPTFNNNNNKDEGSLVGTKRKKPTVSTHGTRSKLSKRAAVNNMKKWKANKEASNTTPANSAFPTPPVQMLNMDAIFGINGSVENEDDDTALSPNSLACGCAIASLSMKRM